MAKPKKTDRIGNLPISQHKAMERMWLQEIGGGTAHLTDKMAQNLEAKGLIETNTVEVPDRLGVFQIRIHRLTIRGHMLYCDWASRQELELTEEAVQPLNDTIDQALAAYEVGLKEEA